jgi:hypothetical protein
MSYIIASLPPLKCFVRREYLYNFTKGHGELEPAIWVSIKALRGQPLPLVRPIADPCQGEVPGLSSGQDLLDC